MSRNHEITVKVSNDEHARIQKKAEQLGLTPSAYLRLVGLIAEITTETPTKHR